MKLLIDMNLSPEWVPLLKDAGWEAVHWSTIGRPNAPDHEILGYARSNQYVIFTHDLDFGSILAATKADCPSVIQIRTQDVTPKYLGRLVFSALHQFEKHLEGGALVTVDEKKLRARVLPFEPQ
jgi:predicted nuclease of predicted toxin-antitoxin system